MNLNTYVIKFKYKIYYNLKKFFGLNNNSHKKNLELETLTWYLTPLLSFTVETDYDNSYIENIKNYIPFKYFDIQETNKNFSKIIFNFALVGDAMTEIYENVIYENKSIYSIFSNMELDNGVLEVLYEKYVIHFMEPDIYKTNKYLFNYFKLKRIEIVEKFVPRKNENYKLSDINIKNLSNGDYFFKQEQFSGKAVDCAIFRIFKNEASVFFFQISINKEKIYTIINLKYLINSFIDYFRYLFKFRIKQHNVYFTYIFDIKNKNELYEKCQTNNLNCIFFDSSLGRFVDFDNYEIKKIKEPNEIFINPFKELSLKLEQKENIEKFWKALFPDLIDKNLNLIYSHHVDVINESYLNKTNIYLLELKPNEINKWINAIDLPKKNIKVKRSMKELVEEEKLLKEIKETKKEFQKQNSTDFSKKLFLMIYKKCNLKYRIILDNGMIKSLKFIPIIEDDGMKFYDVYFIIEKVKKE